MIVRVKALKKKVATIVRVLLGLYGVIGAHVQLRVEEGCKHHSEPALVATKVKTVA